MKFLLLICTFFLIRFGEGQLTSGGGVPSSSGTGTSTPVTTYYPTTTSTGSTIPTTTYTGGSGYSSSTGSINTYPTSSSSSTGIIGYPTTSGSTTYNPTGSSGFTTYYPTGFSSSGFTTYYPTSSGFTTYYPTSSSTTYYPTGWTSYSMCSYYSQLSVDICPEPNTWCVDGQSYGYTCACVEGYYLDDTSNTCVEIPNYDPCSNCPTTATEYGYSATCTIGIGVYPWNLNVPTGHCCPDGSLWNDYFQSCELSTYYGCCNLAAAQTEQCGTCATCTQLDAPTDCTQCPQFKCEDPNNCDTSNCASQTCDGIVCEVGSCRVVSPACDCSYTACMFNPNCVQCPTVDEVSLCASCAGSCTVHQNTCDTCAYATCDSGTSSSSTTTGGCIVCDASVPQCDPSCKNCTVAPVTCNKCAYAICEDPIVCVECPSEPPKCETNCSKCSLTTESCSQCSIAYCEDEPIECTIDCECNPNAQNSECNEDFECVFKQDCSACGICQQQDISSSASILTLLNVMCFSIFALIFS